MRAAFIAATVAEQEHTGGVVEICAVLNRLPPRLLRGSDKQVIDEVDALMDDLYQQGELTCPGHRWLSGPPPASIRGHLVRLHEHGKIYRDAASRDWKWDDLTSYFAMPGRLGPMAAHTGGRLFRFRWKRSGPEQQG
ncbi:hypothetical protein [Streptomyces cavernae]|uniref:hypothetical protein n=1 Tax=Streptomyces cavernae TaxID=2259034 RepID=UPI000FEBA4F2|nr:hypothetical protein [Streptomyces cavernae]